MFLCRLSIVGMDPTCCDTLCVSGACSLTNGTLIVGIERVSLSKERSYFQRENLMGLANGRADPCSVCLYSLFSGRRMLGFGLRETVASDEEKLRAR